MASDEIKTEIEERSEPSVFCDLSKDQPTNEPAASSSTEPTSVSAQPETTLTKNQRKKLQKIAKWEENKAARRAKSRQRRKEVKLKARQGLIEDYQSRKFKKGNKMATSECKVAVAIDMSFDDLMIEKDLAKCIKQISWCYSVNRSIKNPLQFFVTSFGGAAKEAVEKHNGWKHWDINFTSKPFSELENYPKEKLVYLSSESENVLTDVKPDFLYIIGGLVDHNQHKGICHSIAVKNGIKHARLPIADYIDMKSRKVLTINHVFEILVKVANGLSWENALIEVIAPRKMPKLKSETIQQSND